MIQAARAAAASLVADFKDPARLRIEEKAPSDFVSSADLRSQEILRASLSASYPGHALLMEEGDHGPASIAPRRLIVDPLDGTTNFLHGLPHFAVTIALEVDGEIIEGLVLDPAKDELFWAAKGEGAWLDPEGPGRRRLHVSREHDLSRSVVGTGIPHHARGDHPPYLEALGHVMHEVGGIRRYGAAALDLSYVAAGRFDAFFELGLAPWDVAAGILLVREAKGTVTRCDGSALRGSLDSGDVLATSGEPLHATMTRMLAPLGRHGAGGATGR
jgi:myo-inositol-1(or 4)-monophosphatase